MGSILQNQMAPLVPPFGACEVTHLHSLWSLLLWAQEVMMAGPDPLQVQCSLPVVPGELTGLEDSPCPVPSRPGVVHSGHQPCIWGRSSSCS